MLYFFQVIRMKTIKEFTSYLYSFNKVSKKLFFITIITCTLLYIACFFVLFQAGDTLTYYTAHEIFRILTENAKGLFAVGMFGVLGIELLLKDTSIEQ